MPGAPALRERAPCAQCETLLASHVAAAEHFRALIAARKEFANAVRYNAAEFEQIIRESDRARAACRTTRAILRAHRECHEGPEPL
jgi:hypothetical protein